jgi:maltooligosyltrehalose trehalohydrolase
MTALSTQLAPQPTGLSTRFGAMPGPEGARFGVWAPKASAISVVVERPGSVPLVAPLERGPDGHFSGIVAEAMPGDRYRYRIDDEGDFPDPASRFQPEGVHGPSEIVDPAGFPWTDRSWKGIPEEDLVLYELHVGTFSPEGTFEGVRKRLDSLRQLGITAIELMPIADFAGRRGWGYDGVDLFAPSRNYGTPDDLRRLVDESHRLGIAVFLDVVYNHFGPVGNYALQFSPYFLSCRSSAWAACVNLDGEGSEMVTEFFIENALHWVHEYHIDGLRLDATHALHDEKPPHFLEVLAERVHPAIPGRRIPLIAEDHRNHDHMIRPKWAGGWDLDGVWADDFHHQVRRHIAGDNEGYYRDYSGSIEDLATTINQGWFYTGEYSVHLDEPRGTDPVGIPARRFVVALQNHDQVGNRPHGDRLHHQVDPAAYRAAIALLLCSPQTPMLFMGQEWAATTPFLYFTDHDEDLGKIVTEGRRREFRHFLAFVDPKAREAIPDPQSPSTFEASRLDWAERAREPHASTLRLYEALLAFRRAEPAMKPDRPGDFRAEAIDEHTLLLIRTGRSGERVAVVVRLSGAGEVNLGSQEAVILPAEMRWQIVLTTEDCPFTTDPAAPIVNLEGKAPVIDFKRPSAVILRAVQGGNAAA